jgi:translation initiation factor IF-2
LIERKAKLRVVRDGVVIHTGELASLKRFKDDVKEVAKGYECGLQVERFNDIEVGDYLEIFKTEEVKRKL